MFFCIMNSTSRMIVEIFQIQPNILKSECVIINENK